MGKVLLTRLGWALVGPAASLSKANVATSPSPGEASPPRRPVPREEEEAQTRPPVSGPQSTIPGTLSGKQDGAARRGSRGTTVHGETHAVVGTGSSDTRAVGQGLWRREVPPSGQWRNVTTRPRPGSHGRPVVEASAGADVPAETSGRGSAFCPSRCIRLESKDRHRRQGPGRRVSLK